MQAFVKRCIDECYSDAGLVVFGLLDDCTDVPSMLEILGIRAKEDVSLDQRWLTRSVRPGGREHGPGATVMPASSAPPTTASTFRAASSLSTATFATC